MHSGYPSLSCVSLRSLLTLVQKRTWMSITRYLDHKRLCTFFFLLITCISQKALRRLPNHYDSTTRRTETQDFFLIFSHKNYTEKFALASVMLYVVVFFFFFLQMLKVSRCISKTGITLFFFFECV